jgi:hypothetical protein
MKRFLLSFCMLLPALMASFAVAQFLQPGRPPARRHTTTQRKEVRLVPATIEPSSQNAVEIKVEGANRVITANGIPNHFVGPFPNRGNPHRIEAQRYAYRVPAKPEAARSPTPLGMQNFGIAVNGVPFDPGAAEWFGGVRGSEWQYEALSGAVPLGIDANHAHVQPTGAYHYHGLPQDLLEKLKVDGSSHSPLAGWAADGFPIYVLYGYEDPENPDSKIIQLKSSYLVKKGRRPGGRGEPGGTCDGTFTADYEYVEGHGNLDECNGRYCVTPEFPSGTYAYFLTEDWPVIPRNFRGTPSKDFERGPRRGHGRR